MSRVARMFRGALVLLATLVLATLLLVPVAAQPAFATRGTIPGVDISQYQETINWPNVDRTKVGFVIMRATKGDTYVDPTYQTNLAGAASNGFVVGAYHRATPSSVQGDAVSEADYFLATARNAAGDLIPALDIEETGGLSVNGLQDWVKTWVERVQARIGVRPMVYASPYFWRTYMGDSRWFAAHGYPLWIANWQVAAPDVPAGNWGGSGWTYWQWSSTGSVRGIPTAVDRDRFNGTDLKMGKIASVTVTPPNGGTVTGSRISCGGGATRCSRLANAGDVETLTATPDPGATFLGWTGACAPAGSTPTCDATLIGRDAVTAIFGYPVTVTTTGSGVGSVSSTPAGLDCPGTCGHAFPAGSTVSLHATPDSASVFDGWGGACSGLSSTCSVTVNGVRSVSATFTAMQREEQDGLGTAFAWGSKRDTRAFGGSYGTDHRAGASMTFGFQGGSVTVYTVDGPAMGKATVSVDGTQVGTINGYAASLTFGAGHRFDGFASGDHQLVITATGTAGAKATGTRVAVDALRWSGALHTNPHPASSTWGTVADPSASGGTYIVNDVAGARASLQFTGTGATLVTLRGPGMGMAQLLIDGEPAGTVDLYAPSPIFGATKTVTGLSDGPHVLTVEVLGTHRPASSGSAVVVDAWIIR